MAVQRIELGRGDLWKSKAKALQLRLRDRFRVVVDRHRRRPHIFSAASDGYFSSTVQRWLNHFRDFRRDSLHSPSAFYRKRVSKDFNADEESVIIRMVQSVAVPLLGNMCHVFMHGLNRVQVYGVEKLHDALLHRPKNKPLLTVSNHVASVDDPFIIASLLPPSVLMDAQNLRWTLCASDRCFKNPVSSAFFQSVKVLPVARGEGIYQKGMDMAIAKLNSGSWVHIFPEGSRSRDGGKTMGSSKRGVGRLILDADTVPLVIPFVHTGMQEIMPMGATLPRIGKRVTVLLGDPIHFDDILGAEGDENISRGKMYDAVASRIGQRLQQLKVQVEKLALEQSVEFQQAAAGITERAADMLQQVDWGSFGAGSHVSTEERDLPCEPRPSQELLSSDRYFRIGFSYDSIIISRMRGYMDSTELLGFAARGLFMNFRAREHTASIRDVGPVRAWKQFLEANLLGQWNAC
ncbi:PREDICTED: tafazzin [Populus euphratica]|uniref:Tafazzin family protein n=1 Tax=Populus euphratica TaxID=75702 RepID=A0AAJ6XZM7_POPEU|nr:PREDICTED: tafazzin [Populus euphratica]